MDWELLRDVTLQQLPSAAVLGLLGLLVAAIARAKGRNFFLWWTYGVGLFIVALPYALFLKPLKCPHCAQDVRVDDTLCHHCKGELAASRASTNRGGSLTRPVLIGAGLTLSTCLAFGGLAVDTDIAATLSHAQVTSSDFLVEQQKEALEQLELAKDALSRCTVRLMNARGVGADQLLGRLAGAPQSPSDVSEAEAELSRATAFATEATARVAFLNRSILHVVRFRWLAGFSRVAAYLALVFTARRASRPA